MIHTNESQYRMLERGNSDLKLVVDWLRITNSVGYVVDEGLRLAYCNPAWDRFAVNNGAPRLAFGRALGSSLFDAVPELLKPFYYAAVQLVRSEGLTWEHSYQASSPQEFRLFRMRIERLAIPGWFSVTNTLVIQRPHASVVRGQLHDYEDEDGFVTMCCNCRRSRGKPAFEEWDFVPDFLEFPPAELSFGMCPACATDYPDPGEPPSSDSATIQ